MKILFHSFRFIKLMGRYYIMKQTYRNERRAVGRFHRRFFVTLFISAVMICMIGYFNKSQVSAYEPTDDQTICYKSILIEPGDSLWSIAKTYMPEECDSINTYIDSLRELNNLDSDELQANEHLMIYYID